ncbi:metallophosphoesterase [Niallia sp.]|uniref:metallophosphoesterase n=1 Tax=Niallia sp. TaxID=2837523 RepID=UPI00289E6FA7|nr:metallophosphoesterase [Niallia sp.]
MVFLWAGFSLLVLFSIAFIIHMKNIANENHVKYEIFYFPNFPSSFREMTFFFISDIHRRTIDDSIIKEAIDVAEMVIIGGDLLEKGVKLEKTRENLRKLKRIGPVYFVWGNNDYEINRDVLEALLKEEEIVLLENKAVSFKSANGESWSLIGIEDYSLEYDNLEIALENVEDHNFKILVSHNPKIMEKLENDNQISLVLSGHTHGGQIRIFGFGPYELGGTKVIGNTTVFVSNGYGTTTIPLRLGARPETHIIKIQHKQNKKEI